MDSGKPERSLDDDVETEVEQTVEAVVHEPVA
jgi:hypothetical protein